MKEDQIAQERIPVRAAEIVSRRGDEENLRTLSVDGHIHLDPGDLFHLIDRKIEG